MKKLMTVIIISLISTLSLANTKMIPVKGLFNIPVGTDSIGPATQGTVYEFNFVAEFTDKITLAAMIAESNDWFIAPADPSGIHPHDIVPILDTIVDITDQFAIYDAGTEIDEPLGNGLYQAPRQNSIDSGPADQNPLVRKVDQANYLIEDFVEVMLIKLNDSEFQITIRVLDHSPSSIAPGVWKVFQEEQNPIFVENTTLKIEGLESLAEDGDPKLLYIHI